MNIKLAFVVCVMLLSACEKSIDQDAVKPKHISLNQATTAGSSFPNLFKDDRGEIWMSYITRSDNITKLWYTRWQENGWLDAELIAQGDNWFINWADFPSIVKTGDTLIAHWLQDNGSGTYAYGIQHTACSQERWGGMVG